MNFKNFLKPSKKEMVLRAMKMIQKEGKKTLSLGYENVQLRLIKNHEGKRGYCFYNANDNTVISDVIIVDDESVIESVCNELGMKKSANQEGV